MAELCRLSTGREWAAAEAEEVGPHGTLLVTRQRIPNICVTEAAFGNTAALHHH